MKSIVEIIRSGNAEQNVRAESTPPSGDESIVRLRSFSNTRKTPDDPDAEHQPDASIGRIVSVSGSQAVIMLHKHERDTIPPHIQVGMLLKIITKKSTVVGFVSALSIPIPSPEPFAEESLIAELELVGELFVSRSNENDALANQTFRRGVSSFPTLSSLVYIAAPHDLQSVFAQSSSASIRIGSFHQDKTLPVQLSIDDLLGGHFAILGSTGTGKSSILALILHRLLAKHPDPHIVVLDPHNEYAVSLNDQAEYLNIDSLRLPFWLLTIEEMCEVVFGADSQKHQTDLLHLSELITLAKQHYHRQAVSGRSGPPPSALRSSSAMAGTAINVDTPVPYRLSDLIYMLDQHMGRLDKTESLIIYKRIKNRLETLAADPRYNFMFGSFTARDDMAEILAQIFRFPTNGKPVTVIDLSALPPEIIDVVVSTISRMAFDFALWSNQAFPITLICEEAHRYIPENIHHGFAPTKRILTRIAKEGRKYKLSLGIISQRPSELAATILSQCGTILALRLTNQHDQDFVRAILSDASVGLLNFLPSLSTAEGVVIGEGINLPARVNFDLLPEHQKPRNHDVSFSSRKDNDDGVFIHDVIENWRRQRRETPTSRSHDYRPAPQDAEHADYSQTDPQNNAAQLPPIDLSRLRLKISDF